MTEPKARHIKARNSQFRIAADPDYASFWDEVSDGSWEPETFTVLESFIQPNTDFVDVGSWIGPTVLFAASLGARCIAVEPDPTARAALSANLSLNPELNKATRISEKCIAAENGTVTLGNPHQANGGDSQSSMLFEDASCSWQVPGITLKSFFEEHNIRTCSLIKVDIEGGEALVIPSAEEFLHKTRPTVYLSLHAPLMKNTRSDLERINAALSTYPFLYSNKGHLIPPSLLLTDTNMSRFFEIIATDIPPSEVRKLVLFSGESKCCPDLDQAALCVLEQLYLKAYTLVRQELMTPTSEVNWKEIQSSLREAAPILEGRSAEEYNALKASLSKLLS